MTYLPSARAPKLSPAQAARMNRWWEWRREQDRILDEAFAAFAAGDTDRFLELDVQRRSLTEPDIYNG